jgi:hypothetical protein
MVLEASIDKGLKLVTALIMRHLPDYVLTLDGINNHRQVERRTRHKRYTFHASWFHTNLTYCDGIAKATIALKLRLIMSLI